LSCRASVVAFAVLMRIAKPAHSGYVLGVGASSCGKLMDTRKVRRTPAESDAHDLGVQIFKCQIGLLASDARGAILLGKTVKL
jgi:hypothetical protein